jgi:hypothetical protein
MDNNINKNTLYYLFGTCSAELITNPIYTITTNYQTNNKNIKNTIFDIYKNKKIFGFYNSAGYAILSRLASSGVKYNIYQNLKIYRNTQNDDLLNNMFNSAISGCIGGIISHPIDVCVNYIQRGEKIVIGKNLFSGLPMTILRNFVLYSLLFSMYDFIKHKTNNIYYACFITSLTTTTVMTPIEYIRTNIMTGNVEYKDIKFKYIYRGYIFNLARNSSHFMITMLILEKMKKKNFEIVM